MLYTKCIFKPRENSDGVRISVMSRHTLNDGVTPDSRITSGSFDRWENDLAPPVKLVGDYYRRGLSWDEFTTRYLNYLREKEVGVKSIATEALQSDITLLCVEDTAEFCHRRLLAEECQRYEPELVVEHK